MPEITVNGVSLHYVVRGQGVPIIFIHPPVLSSVNFTYQLDKLSKEFMVIAFDIRGHGRSHPSPQIVTYPLIVQDIKEIMDHLTIDKAFLCGYSTGGSIALEFLLTFPKRALGAILLSGLSEVSDWRLQKYISLGVSLAKMGASSTLAYSISWSNSDTMSTFQTLLKDAKKVNIKNAGEYYGYSLAYTCTNQLQHIHCPVLSLYGTKDKGFYRYGKLIHTHLPHSEIAFIRNVTHHLPTKAHDEVNRQIQQFVSTAHL